MNTKKTTNWFSDLRELKNSKEYGGKSGNLGRLIGFGVEVPDGFSISDSAFSYFIELNGLRSRIDEILEKTDFSEPQEIQNASDKILTLFRESQLDESLKMGLKKYVSKLKSDRIIVRSSAIGEDDEAASFAGQLDSFAILNSWNDLECALKNCWASFWSSRALAYQHVRGSRLGGMGVVIQELVDAEFSGVLFTAAPVMDDSDGDWEGPSMLLEYVRGAGEQLVSGHVNPGRILIEKNGEGEIQLSLPEQPGPAERLNLKPQHLKKIRQAAQKIESSMGAPQDIEWCFDSLGNLKIVQSRPITVKTSGDKIEKILWSNVNVNENYPDPISPLLYSVALTSFYHYFRNLGLAFGVASYRLEKMEPSLLQIVGNHCGRIYYNLSHIYKVIATLPFGGKVASYFDEFVGVDVGVKVRKKHKSRFFVDSLMAQFFEVLKIAFVSARTLGSVPKGVKSFETDVDAFVKQCNKERLDHAKPSWKQLQWEYLGFLEIRFRKWLRASLADASAMFSYGLLTSFLKRSLTDPGNVHNTLLKGILGVVSAIPPQRLWDLGELARRECSDLVLGLSTAQLNAELDNHPRLSRFKKEIERFQQEWGFRCSGELMLSQPNFTEDRVSLLEIVKGFTAHETPSPHLIVEGQYKERLKLEQEIGKKLSGFLPLILSPKYGIFRLLLSWTHNSIAFRERVRMKQAMLYGQFRRTCLDLGAQFVERGLLNSPEDLLFLRYQETVGVLDGSEMMPWCLKDTVEIRKVEFKRISQHTPPDSFSLPKGSFYDPKIFAEQSKKENDDSHSSILQGAGACGGLVKGSARVLTSVLEAKLLCKGDILVTRQTDPGWAPVFPLIKGLVMERGGMLSHGAIVAREFGIPAVVGVANATTRISQGQQIEVNGDAGSVSLHP